MGDLFSQRYLNIAENSGQEQVAATYVSFIPLKIISCHRIFHFLYPSCINGRRRQFEKKGYAMMTLLAFRPSSALSLGMWEHHDRITTPRRAGSMAARWPRKNAKRNVNAATLIKIALVSMFSFCFRERCICRCLALSDNRSIVRLYNGYLILTPNAPPAPPL